MIMSKHHSTAAVVAIIGLLAPALSGFRGQSGAGLSGPSLEAFLDKAADRFKTFAEPSSWTATVVSTRTRMDRKWTPEAVTVVRKSVTFNGEERDETVLEARETKDGRTRDVTAAVAAETKKSLERERSSARRAEESAKAGTESRRSDRISLDEIIPFSAKKRPEYVFRPADGGALDGAPAFILDIEPKIKDDRHWRGRLWFDPETADLRRAEIRPADNPPFVKEVDIAVSFDTHPSGPIVLRSFRIKINAGFFLKHVRQLIVEEYSDYRMGTGTVPPGQDQ